VLVQTPTVGASPTSVCVNSSSTLTASASAGSTTILSENFNGANSWTTANTSSGGSNPANAAWTLRPDGYMNTGGTIVYTFHSNDNSQFYLTNADAAGSGVTVSTVLQSPSFSTVGYTSASLQFYHHYSDFSANDQAAVEISTNGTTWSNLQTYTSDQGTESSFVLATISLTPYVGNAAVYIRFKYDAGWDWFWAVDNVTITGTPSTVSYSWTASPATGAGLPVGAGTLSTSNNNVSVTPTAFGTYTYSVSTSNSCLATGSVTVTSTATGGLASSTTTCQSANITSGNNYILAGSCVLLAKIVPQGGATELTGNVNVCVRIEGGTTFYNAEPYLMRHFDIEPSTPTLTATARVTLYVLQSEFADYNTNCGGFPQLPASPSDAAGISNLRITQWHGTPSTQPLPGYYSGGGLLINPADADIVWDATNNWWAISFDVTGFSGFFIHSTVSGFPLSSGFTIFNGRRQGAVNLLNWKTATEQNIKGYEVQRSYDGQHFSSIGFVNSQAPGGNSNSLLQYSFTDNSFSGEKQYYRLRQVANDCRIAISSFVPISDSLA